MVMDNPRGTGCGFLLLGANLTFTKPEGYIQQTGSIFGESCQSVTIITQFNLDWPCSPTADRSTSLVVVVEDYNTGSNVQFSASARLFG